MTTLDVSARMTVRKRRLEGFKRQAAECIKDRYVTLAPTLLFAAIGLSGRGAPLAVSQSNWKVFPSLDGSPQALQGGGSSGGPPQAGDDAYATSCLRHRPARGWGRPADDSGASRSRESEHHGDSSSRRGWSQEDDRLGYVSR